MLNFPQEILNSKKTITIAVAENNELIFSTDNQEGEEWKPWELYGAIQFAAQTFGLPTSTNASNNVQEPSGDVPEMKQLEFDFPENPEQGQVIKSFEQFEDRSVSKKVTHPPVTMNYSGDHSWLKRR